MQQHVVELQVAMRHLVPVERRQRAHHPRYPVVQETTVSRERLPRHTLAYVPMPAVLHREAPALRLFVHVAAVHLQNVVVARKTLVEVHLRLYLEDLKYIFEAICNFLPLTFTSAKYTSASAPTPIYRDVLARRESPLS